MERATRPGEGSAAESSPFCSLLNRCFYSLLFLFSTLFQSFQIGTYRQRSHGVLKWQPAYKARIYVVKSLHSVGSFLLFYFLSGDRAARGPASRLLGVAALRSGRWVRRRSRTGLGALASHSQTSLSQAWCSAEMPCSDQERRKPFGVCLHTLLSPLPLLPRLSVAEQLSAEPGDISEEGP